MGRCSSEFPFNSFPSYPLAPISENSVWKSLTLLNSWKLQLVSPTGKLVHALRIKACQGWTDKMSQWIFRKSELVGKKKKVKYKRAFCFVWDVVKARKNSIEMLVVQ